MSQIKVLLTGLLFILLQITLLNIVTIQGIKPDLIVLFIVGRALAAGPTAGVIWGFCLGFLLDTISGGPTGLGALAYSLSGFISGQIGSGRTKTQLRYLITLALGAVVSFGVFYYFREPWNIIGWTKPLLTSTLPGIIYTWALGLIWVLTPFAQFKEKKGRG